MRLPEVTIAGVFLSGIALGLHTLVARLATSAVAILLIAGIISAKFGQLRAAAISASFC
jgi:hypothetical protein